MTPATAVTRPRSSTGATATRPRPGTGSTPTPPVSTSTSPMTCQEKQNALLV